MFLKSIASISFVTIALASASFAADAPHFVATTGKCTQEVIPDRASINFSVEKVNKDVKVAITDATELHEKLLAALKKIDAKNLELSTSDYSVYEKKEYQKDREVSLGFAARYGVKAVVTEVADVSKLITAAGEIGIDQTSDFYSFLSDQKELDAKKKCLTTAAQNAREKAQVLATALGAKTGKVIAITEKGNSSYAPVRDSFPGAQSMMMKAAIPSPTITGKSQTIELEVDASFELE